MKKYSRFSILLSAALILGCAQEIDDLKQPEAESTPTGSLGTNINVSNFVTIGNSLVAGYQANALFTDGQNESIGKIIHQQMVYAGATGDFNQPDINSVNGYSGMAGPLVLGRLILFDPDGAGPRGAGPAASGTPERPAVTCPSAVPATPALPAPYNTGDLPTPFAGDKTKLNNFGVPGIQVGQLLTTGTGTPGNAAFNPLWARFATNPTGKTILQDALAVNPTFVLIEVGNNDVLGYATSGAVNSAIFTSEADFKTRYDGLIATILGTLPATVKGVVANIPDVTSIPFFFTVAHNPIPMDAATAATVNGAFAGYNAVLDGIKSNSGLMNAYGLTAAGLDARKVSFTAGTNNKILIYDKKIADLGGAFDALVSAGAMTPAQRTALEPYRRVRQTTPTDLVTLPAGGVIGTCVGGNPMAINGISVPLADQYVLVPEETLEIKTRTAQFNAIIAANVAASNNRLALADVNTAFNNFVSTRGAIMNGIMLTPSITPPYAGFSEDGVHPNGRGYAFLANIFIEAINAKFGSTIPKANITKYRGTRTPITPTNSY